jgi:hypothetical protein
MGPSFDTVHVVLVRGSVGVNSVQGTEKPSGLTTHLVGSRTTLLHGILSFISYITHPLAPSRGITRYPKRWILGFKTKAAQDGKMWLMRSFH